MLQIPRFFAIAIVQSAAKYKIWLCLVETSLPRIIGCARLFALKLR